MSVMLTKVLRGACRQGWRPEVVQSGMPLAAVPQTLGTTLHLPCMVSSGLLRLGSGWSRIIDCMGRVNEGGLFIYFIYLVVYICPARSQC